MGKGGVGGSRKARKLRQARGLTHLHVSHDHLQDLPRYLHSPRTPGATRQPSTIMPHMLLEASSHLPHVAMTLWMLTSPGMPPYPQACPCPSSLPLPMLEDLLRDRRGRLPRLRDSLALSSCSPIPPRTPTMISTPLFPLMVGSEEAL